MTSVYRFILFLEQNLLTVQIRKRPVLERIIWPLQFRSTSVAEDEALCISNLLRLDMRRIISVPARERMAQIWTLLDERGDLRQSVLFHTGPKLDIDRFRWAPRTLLGLNGMATSADGPVARLSENGLLFDCPGFVLHYNGYRPLDEFTFKSFGNCKYVCGTRKPASDFDCKFDEIMDDIRKKKASVPPKGFLAILINTSYLDVPESGLENCSYPKMDVCTTRFDESIFQDVSIIEGVLVSIERVEGETCYVSLLSSVSIAKVKDVPVRMEEYLGALFDDRLHS